MLLIDIGSDLKFRYDAMVEPEGFQFDIQLGDLEFFVKADRTLCRIIQNVPDQLGKTGQVIRGHLAFRFQDITVDGIKAVENKMGIHPGPQGLQFQLSQLP